MHRDRLPSALVADALDAVGLRRRCLGAGIRMLNGDRPLVGRALTASTTPISGDPPPADLYAGLKAVLRRLGPDDVLVLATDRSDDYATWGELVSIAALQLGALGIVTDGLVRDLGGISRLPFAVFARGTRPVDIAGRADFVGIGVPIVVDGVEIEAGDLVVGDRDGVAVVPRAVEDSVLGRALGKAADERGFHEALANGVPIWEAFDRFGVL
jgi:4-hydroxy-4-methyl-2-oxoglutarate aldolase